MMVEDNGIVTGGLLLAAQKGISKTLGDSGPRLPRLSETCLHRTYPSLRKRELSAKIEGPPGGISDEA